MLDNILPAPYAHVYVTALYARVFLWFAVAVLVLAWHQWCLNELKCEATAISDLSLKLSVKSAQRDRLRL